MKLHRRVSLLVAVTMLAGGVAHAQQVEVEPVFERQDVWFHRTQTPVTNVDARSGQVPTWSTTRPTDSAPLGAGGIYAAHHYSFGIFSQGMEHNPAYGFTAAGKFTGDINNLAVTLYGHVPAYVALPQCAGGIALSFDFRIDGKQVLYQPQSQPSAYLNTDPVSAGFVTVKFRLTNLYQAMKDYGIATGPDVEHDVYLNAMNFYACNEVVWVYDSAEAPAGAIFNLPDADASGYSNVDVYDPPPPYSG